MRKLPMNIHNERRLKSLTGLSYEKYEKLLTVFTSVYEQSKAEEEKNKQRRRNQGGGRKNGLPTIEIKLLFLLYYFKTYPTFEVFADRFGMKTSAANKQFHKLVPLLYSALEDLGVMPKRSYESVDDFKSHLESIGGIKELILDATEREHFRYKDVDKRNAMYSGKKKSSL